MDSVLVLGLNSGPASIYFDRLRTFECHVFGQSSVTGSSSSKSSLDPMPDVGAELVLP